MKTRSTAFDARQVFRPRLLEIFNQPYRRSDLLADVMAGITVGLIALPLALALGIASIPAGTQTPYPPPAVGLFTAIFAGLVISSLGGSRVQIGGPTAAFIPIVLLIIEKYGYPGLILATLMAGGILIAMGLARMGNLIKFIPWPVTSGFTTGIAVSIMATQAVDFLGIHAESPPPREFFHRPSARSLGLAPFHSGCRHFNCRKSAWNESGLLLNRRSRSRCLGPSNPSFPR